MTVKRSFDRDGTQTAGPEAEPAIPYVFWLFDWGDHSIGSHMRLVPHYARCDITKEQITIYDENQTLMIRLNAIQQYEEIRIYDNGSTSNLKLVFRSKAIKNNKSHKKYQEIFLLESAMDCA